MRTMFKFSSEYSSKDQMFLCIYIIILHNSLPLAKKKNTKAYCYIWHFDA